MPSGSYCVLELPTNVDLMYSEVRYANELDIVVTTTDNNSGTSIMTTDDGIITPSFAAAIIVGKSSITYKFNNEHFMWCYTKVIHKYWPKFP